MELGRGEVSSYLGRYFCKLFCQPVLEARKQCVTTGQDDTGIEISADVGISVPYAGVDHLMIAHDISCGSVI